MPEGLKKERYEEMTDEEIALLARDGDDAAQEFLLNKYKNFVRSKARSYFLIGADHEDIVQEGMIGLFKAIRDFRPDKLSSFRAFAELCVTRQIITAIKTATRQKHIPLNSYVSLNRPIYDEESDRTLMDVLSEVQMAGPEELLISQEDYSSVENRISEVKGVYVPFWLFDADADAHIRYHATRIRTWSDRDYDYTETQHYAILRSGDLSFTHVPVDGSSRMPNDLMESIEPFDFSSAVDFQTAYLSGYLADRYDVNADDSIGRANERVKKSTESVFASTVVGYHTVVPESTSVRLANGRVHYALYPVWLLNTVWNGKTFSFAMNGQTGKFVGDLPVDKGKKWRWFGLVSGIAAAAAYGLVCLWQLLH